MLSKTLFLLASVAQAYRVVSNDRDASVSAASAAAPSINGILTSFRVLEGSGCPAGTFTPQPIEAGKSINTYVDFDSWLYNSTTSPGPLDCTLTAEFEFTYPEGGEANLLAGSIAHIEAKYEEDDEARETNFVLAYNIAAQAGSKTIDAAFNNVRIREGPARWEIGANLYVTGTPGAVDTGVFTTKFDAFTDFGPGEHRVNRIEFGFGLLE